MRLLAVVVLVFVGSYNTTTPVRAEQSNSCQVCRDMYKACHYSPATCKIEYERCLKMCGRK